MKLRTITATLLAAAGLALAPATAHAAPQQTVMPHVQAPAHWYDGAAPAAAAAVTWTNLGVLTDTTYVDDCSGTAGAVRASVQWQINRANNTLRLDPNYDLKIENNSDGFLRIVGENGQGGQPVASISYIRTAQNNIISNYTHSFDIAPHSYVTISVDNPVRWRRMDGVADSDPSPSGTAIATASDPALSITAAVYGPGGICGGYYGYVTEILNNAA